jgi:predicted GH43/DUF377 family glycosyl hydrolase
MDYICDIGVAVSDDGVNFTKDTEHSPFFRNGEDRQYSYEDVNIAKYGDTYYLFATGGIGRTEPITSSMELSWRLPRTC